MNISCNSCNRRFKANAKLEATLEALEPGKQLRIKCIGCGEPILLGAKPSAGTKPPPTDRDPASHVKPPGPPDVSWLSDGTLEDEDDVVGDIPQALVMMAAGDERDEVAGVLSNLGYLVERMDDIDQAIERMRFFDYACIVLHSSLVEGPVDENRFHRYLSSMNMSKRRYIIYTLIGPEFETFYDLQALTLSANVVVNSKDLPHLGLILRKAIPDYEGLFGPYLEELKAQRR